MVEVNGIEPMTCRFDRSPKLDLLQCSHRTIKVFKKNGGGERDRTDDLLLAKQALSQLSYTPVKFIS